MNFAISLSISAWKRKFFLYFDMDSIEHIDQYWEYCHVNDIKSSTMNISCVSIYLGLIYFNDVSLLSITLMEKCINNLRYAGDTTLVSESEEELKSPLKKVKEESEKAGLKLNILKTRIMASSSITSWHIDRETTETVTDFIFLGSKITVDD